MLKNALVVAAAAGMLILPAAAMAKTVTLVATLNSANETAGGHPDGSGSFSAEIDDESGDVCYVLSVENIGDAVAAHIHAGAAGTDGAPVITLEVTGPDDDMCLAAEPDALKPIVAAPKDFYVNVHTADHPNGAVRGQLAKKKS